MSEENLMCPICGGLHPVGHRDKELKQKLEAIKIMVDALVDQWTEVDHELKDCYIDAYQNIQDSINYLRYILSLIIGGNNNSYPLPSCLW